MRGATTNPQKLPKQFLLAHYCQSLILGKFLINKYMNREYLNTLFDFTGRSIWVVGGAGYLGGPAVYALARAGARVLCVDRPGEVQRFIDECGYSESIIPANLDAFDVEAVRAFVKENLQKFGTPHGLFNLTTGSSRGPMDDLDAAKIDESAHRSLSCAFELVHPVGKAMVAEGRGSIVLTSSMYGTVAPNPDNYHAPMPCNPLDYGACKAGVQAMARYFAVMWGRYGVRCNSISPGPFPKPPRVEQDPDFCARLAKSNPSGRIGNREEIAGPAIFLLAEASSYVNGQNLAADGGWTSW